MNFLSLILLSANSEEVINESVTQTDSIIGIGGIIATIVVGLITCLVTWKLTMRSIEQQKIEYSKEYFNILSNSIQGQKNSLNSLKIKFEEKELENPTLLLFSIKNTGNKAISNPPIMIKSDCKIIPGYFQDITPGYENKWKMNSINENTCQLKLEHVNPGQIVRVFFIVENDQSNIVFECPMENVNVQEKVKINSQRSHGFLGANRLQKFTIAFSVLSVAIFLTIDFWYNFLKEVIWEFNLRIPPIGLLSSILAFFIITILLNVFGFNKLDEFLFRKKLIFWTELLIPLLSLLLIIFIVFDIFIVNYILQIITALIVIVIMAYFMHLLSLDKN